MKKSYVARIIIGSLIISLVLNSAFAIAGGEEEEEEEGLEEYTELTGTLNYILFGFALLIMPWRYIYKNYMPKLDRKDQSRETLRSIDDVMKKLHYIVGFFAVLVVTYHAYLVISKWNWAVVGGLILIWIYMISGILFLLDGVPAGVKKWSYSIHGSKIYLVITAALLLVGHLLFD